MHVAQIGNFEPPFSTENDLNHAMEANGWTVAKIQEGSDDIRILIDGGLDNPSIPPDFILWTSTRDLANKWGHELQWELLAEARRFGVPVVGYHLDRWWGLKRWEAVVDEPYFKVDLLITADGGHQAEWESLGLNHRWMPPGVSKRWCQLGEFKEELATDIVFTGSWQDYGHREWRHRMELVAWLQKTYGDRVAFYPKQGQHAVRGLDLNDIYWSAKVVVGDSCLAPKVDGSPMTHYCSDRVPETLGRGGILLHPLVDGVHATRGGDFAYAWWELGDWSSLRSELDGLLAMDDEQRLDARLQAIGHIRENHTYTVRMKQLEELMILEGML